MAIMVDPELFAFTLETLFPTAVFPPRTFVSQQGSFNGFIDTKTVMIVGLGRREEVLVSDAIGDETDGQPVDFDSTKQPDGRHFSLSTFPVVEDSLKVFRFSIDSGVEEELSEDDFEFSLEFGYVVLSHPLRLKETLRVQYVAEPDINDPELFFDIDSIEQKHGNASLENTLSLAASFAFLNGAERVLACQADNSGEDPTWTQAFVSLEKEEGYYLVPVPIDNYVEIVAAAKQHVIKMSSVKQRKERVLVAGETADLTQEDIDLLRDTFRALFLTPLEATTIISGETTILDGRYLAAAASGKMSSFANIALSLTRKELLGFSIAKKHVLPDLESEGITDQGIILTRPRSGQSVQVFRATTTTDSQVIEEVEPSIVRISDFIAKNIRKELSSRFVGRVIVPTVLAELTRAIEAFLKKTIQQGLLTTFANLTVKPDLVEPRQVNVTFQAEPVFPLNKIVIRFSFIV